MLSISLHSKSSREFLYKCANRNEKHPHSTMEKISDSYCYLPFQPFEAILLNTGQNSRSNRYANTIAVNVLCSVFYCFSFPHFHVFSLVIALSLPYPFNPLLSLLVKTKGFNLFNSFFPLSFTHVKKILF